MSTDRHNDTAGQASHRQHDRATAESVRTACVRALEAAWEDASIQGLCAAGAFEYALDQLRHAPLDDLIDEENENDGASNRSP